ncbi:MAG TPA: inositol monophosphatase family protein [Actinomycetales bacterium]|nr:inositol monophosphatase family protein [Actinomycetales bacterium]
MDALTVATEIVTAGGELAAARQDGVSERTKGDVRSLAGAVVTDVDLAVERYVDETLAARCPDDGLVGEEYANRRGTSPRTWVVDPVDGTLNYARRLGPWSVVLSAWTGDEPELVAVWSDGRCWTATRGGGAHLDGAALHVPVDPEPKGIVTANARLVGAVAARGWLGRTVESAAIQMCQVADGRSTGTIRLRGDRRDTHGPALLVAEAGGTVTDLDGRAWSASSRGLVAARAGVHAELLALVPPQ